MITQDNFKSVLASLSHEDIAKVLSNHCNDYIGLYITGNYGDAILTGYHGYEEEDEEEIQSTGGLYCDMDTFYQLYKETGLNIPAIEQFI